MNALNIRRFGQERIDSSIQTLNYRVLFKTHIREFPGSPAAKTPHSECRRLGLDPWSGNWIPGQETSFQTLQLRVHMPQLKILHATGKTIAVKLINFLKKLHMTEHCESARALITSTMLWLIKTWARRKRSLRSQRWSMRRPTDISTP